MRKMLNVFKTITAILACPLLLMACAHQTPTRSGFLADYADLQPQAKDAKLETATAPGAAEFGAVIVEPVRFVSAAPDKTPADEAGQALCRTLEEALAEEFSDLSPTAATASRTLHIKAAITGVDRSRPLLNLVTALALFVPVDNGGVSVEIEAIDEESGRRIAAMSGARNGSPFALSGFFHQYGHAEGGLKDLAKEFRRLVPATMPPSQPITQN